MENKNMKPNEENALTDEQLSQVSGGVYSKCVICGYAATTIECIPVCPECGSRDIKYTYGSIQKFA